MYTKLQVKKLSEWIKAPLTPPMRNEKTSCKVVQTKGNVFNNALITLYLDNVVSDRWSSACQMHASYRKEGNVLFKDALNTFYLQLYGVRHKVKDHSDSERGNPLLPHGRNSSMGPPWRIDLTTHRIMSERSYHGATSRSTSYWINPCKWHTVENVRCFLFY